MTHLQNRSGGGKRTSEKYFISCRDVKDTKSWLKGTDTLKLSDTQAIVKALITDGISRKNNKVVIKIGSSETIRKEYNIGKTLQNIHGFLHFICLMQCNDNIRRYHDVKENDEIVICSYDVSDILNNVIVMPYISGGSFRNFAWMTKDEKCFQSCLKQLITSLYLAFIHHGFIHSDIHLDNVLIKKTNKQQIYYDNGFHVDTHGFLIFVMDFENAFIPVETNLTHLFWADIIHIFHDIRYTMKLRFQQQNEIEAFLYTKKDKDLKIDITPLLNLIDDISEITKEKVFVMRYNPYFL